MDHAIPLYVGAQLPVIFINIEASPAPPAASLLPFLVTNFASPKGIEIQMK